MRIVTLAWVCLVLHVQAGELGLGQEDLVIQIRAGVTARTNGTTTQMFSSYSDGTRFVRNPRFWLNGLNGLAATQVGPGAGATAITPWHILEANHFKNEVGAKLYFCDALNHTVMRTVIAGTAIGHDVGSDTWLAVLDNALPPSISPMWLMPPDWTNHVLLSRVPVAALNKEWEFGAAEILSFSQPVKGWFTYGYLYHATSLAPSLQFRPLKAGDSGRPIVAVVGANLVLLGHLTFEPGEEKFLGPDYSRYGPEIQSAIKTLSTNETAKGQLIRTIDLSRFR